MTSLCSNTWPVLSELGWLGNKHFPYALFRRALARRSFGLLMGRISESSPLAAESKLLPKRRGALNFSASGVRA